MMKKSAYSFLAFFMVGMFAVPVMGQGVLISESPDHDFHLPRHHWNRPQPRPQGASYRIKDISINASIDGQVATTQVSQTFVNTGSTQIEAAFVFPLPYDGAVDRMTFLVDGKEYEAKLLDAGKAREIYEGYVRRNKDPALLEWMGQGMFKTSVFPIPAGARRTVQIRYTQLLRQDMGINDFLVPLSTAKYTDQPIETFSVKATIRSNDKLKNIYSPTHDIQVDRSGDNMAVIKVEISNFIPANDLRIMYSTDNRALGASLVSYWPNEKEDGYFTLLTTPDIRQNSDEPRQKSVIFVVDRSGSMNGKKMEQARSAAKFVLDNLRENDLFNVIAYDTDVQSFRPELQRWNPTTHSEALAFVEGLFAGGSTNIDGALQTAFAMVGDSSVPTYIVFLTDGLPTKGETNESKIAVNAKSNNRHGARLISFGVGFDVNSRLLDRLTRENRGQSQYVRPDEDLEEHVSRLYSRISAPVLTDVSIEYLFENRTSGAPAVNRVYPAEVLDLFAGQQLVLVGRYRGKGAAKVKISGRVGDESQSFEYDVGFAEPLSNSQFAFAARLWAVRRIGEIIDLIDLEGQNKELIDELVRLSTEHGVLTPYTSYLADDMASPTELSNRELNFGRTRDQLQALSQAGGQSGFAQRGIKQAFKSADNAAAPQAALPAAPGGGGGGGGSLGGNAAGGGLVLAGEEAESNKNVDEIVRRAGKETAYLRGKTLVASNAVDIDLEKDKDQIVDIQRFSSEYFDLLKRTTRDENQLLALQESDEVMVVRLQGKVYRIQ
jgi:Ca-activated chloride channel family protein